MDLEKSAIRNLAAIFVIVVTSSLLMGCYTLENSQKVARDEIAGSKERTGHSAYSHEITRFPTTEDPETIIKIFKEEQYKVEFRDRYKGNFKRGVFPKTVMWFGLGVGLLSPLIYGIYGQEELIVEFFVPSACGFVLLAATPLFVKKEKVKHYYKPAKPGYVYSPSKPLANSLLSISHFGKRKAVQSDKNGLIKFNPVDDFKVVQSGHNLTIDFKIGKNGQSFANPIQLKPSTWMQQYARITAPKCEISSASSIARKGMEYRIVTESFNNYEIQLLNHKTGYIPKNCAKAFYSVPLEQDISTAIKKHVEDEMNQWLEQGEFEGPEAYAKRMAKRNTKLKELTNSAIQLYQSDYRNLINWSKVTISKYDPNSQTFKVNIPDLEKIIISVPLSRAEEFKINWSRAIIKEQQFELVDGKWELSSLMISNPAINFSVNYDAEISNIYNPTNQFAFELNPIEINIPQASRLETNNEELDDNYSINTNLPITKTTNPDAIAVVIGNVNYRAAPMVRFAVNDAQLIKVYLTNVLGFKPANIIFERDATKGVFEGLFGTQSNHKAKLYNAIKHGESDVFIFYSGHGAPDVKTEKGFFVPVDADPQYINIQG